MTNLIFEYVFVQATSETEAKMAVIDKIKPETIQALSRPLLTTLDVFTFLVAMKNETNLRFWANAYKGNGPALLAHLEAPNPKQG